MSLPDSERDSAPSTNTLSHRGAKIDRYLLTACVGADRRREVFRAFDPVHGRDVVIRLMRDGVDLDAAHRTLAQARALTRLVHPNVQRLYDVGTHWGRVFVALEPNRDPSLAAWLRAGRPLAQRRIALLEAGEGLVAAHAASVVHGDFSAISVRVRGERCDGGSPSAYVVEFAAERGLQLPGMGTTAFMAPELFDGGAPNVATDQFAFCVATFVALTGSWPYAGTTLEARADAVRAGRLVIGSAARELPRGVLDGLARGLCVDARQRWPSMSTLLAALKRTPDFAGT